MAALSALIELLRDAIQQGRIEAVLEIAAGSVLAAQALPYLTALL